jgi:hypothetical protein
MAVVSRRFQWLGLACLGASLVVLLVMALMPVKAASPEPLRARARRTGVAVPQAKDPGPLLERMAGLRLIRPAQVRAAVMDSGAAARMLKKLKLQGVVHTGQTPVAYIKIDGGGTVAARRGDTVLDLVVERIDPGKVTLSLEGVIVELVH